MEMKTAVSLLVSSELIMHIFIHIPQPVFVGLLELEMTNWILDFSASDTLQAFIEVWEAGSASVY